MTSLGGAGSPVRASDVVPGVLVWQGLESFPVFALFLVLPCFSYSYAPVGIGGTVVCSQVWILSFHCLSPVHLFRPCVLGVCPFYDFQVSSGVFFRRILLMFPSGALHVLNVVPQ